VTKGKPIDKLGLRDSPQGDLAFDNVHIPDDYMIIRPPFYEYRVGQIICVTSSFMAAVFTGLARAAFEEATEVLQGQGSGRQTAMRAPIGQAKALSDVRNGRELEVLHEKGNGARLEQDLYRENI